METNSKVDTFLKRIHDDSKLNLDARIQTIKDKKKIYSDVTDNEGNYYVDLVQQGGGVWGVALLGYVYVLELLNIRFFSLAGTSAGAINTMAMAAIPGKKEPKATRILNALLHLKLQSLIDGKSNNRNFTQWERKLINRFVKNPKYGSLIKYFSLALLLAVVFLSIVSICCFYFVNSNCAKPVYATTCFVWLLFLFLSVMTYIRLREISKDGFGLNDGTVFYNWVTTELLQKYNVHNLHDLKTNLEQVPQDLKLVEDREGNPPTQPRLNIVTNDVTTNNKIEFPRMWDLYYSSLEAANPADFVRASMSIPIFFEMFELQTNPKNTAAWNKHLNWGITTNNNLASTIPAKVNFVDGGSLSNFPINTFFDPNFPTPRKPTFGIRLVEERRPIIKPFKGIMDFAGNIINSMKVSSDKEFLNKYQSYNLGIGYVEIGKELSWLNFYMTDDEQKQLFIKGAQAALDFMEQFDWETYKNERKKDYYYYRDLAQHDPNNWDGVAPSTQSSTASNNTKP